MKEFNYAVQIEYYGNQCERAIAAGNFESVRIYIKTKMDLAFEGLVRAWESKEIDDFNTFRMILNQSVKISNSLENAQKNYKEEE